MNIYKIENHIGDVDAEILPGLLRHALLEKMPEFEADPVFSLAYDDHNQFFLKNDKEIIWGRVFLESPGYNDLEKLGHEIDQLSRKFQRKLSPYIFMPARFSEAYPRFDSIPGNPQVLEYYFLKAGMEHAIALKEIPVASHARPASAQALARDEKYSFYKHARLNRRELAELIDLSLDYKRLSQ